MGSLFKLAAFLMLVTGGAGCAARAPMATATGSSSGMTSEPRDESSAERRSDLDKDDGRESIAAIHRRKCGTCHTRVEPGSVSRATAESAMQRHRRRAKLTDRQWADMVDYLSADGLGHARPAVL